MITKEQRAEMRRIWVGSNSNNLNVAMVRPIILMLLDSIDEMESAAEHLAADYDAAVTQREAFRTIINGVAGHFLENQGDDAQIGGEISDMTKDCMENPLTYNDVRERMSNADERGDS